MITALKGRTPLISGNRETEDKEPERWIDRNIYHYRLIGGVMVLKGITLGNGWENQEFIAESLSCYKAKGGNASMPGRRGFIGEPEDLLKTFIEGNYKINPVGKRYRVTWQQAKDWLVHEGIIDKFNNVLIEKPEPPMEENMAEENQVPELSIESEPEKEFLSPDELVEETEQHQDTIEPEIIGFDVAAFKLDMIRIILRETGLRKAPAKVGLDIVGAIQGA
jgi:hypothetical protein